MDFSNMFGHIKAGMCRLSVNGGIAIKTSNGYKTYNVDTGNLTNVTQFCFDIGEELFFVMPTTKAKKGDILLIDGHPKCVVETPNDKTIKVIDYETSTIQEIVPERHVFLGKTYFYSKIVSMFGSGNFLKGSKGMSKMMKLMMMKSMLGGKTFGESGSSDQMNPFGGGLIGMMMMSQMFSGSGGLFGDDGSDFEDMFDIDLDGEDIELADEENEPKTVKAKAKSGK